MAASTRSRVRCEIGRFPLITYETVLCDTPATRATSLLVNATTPAPLPSIRIVDAYRNRTSNIAASTRPRAGAVAPNGAPAALQRPKGGDDHQDGPTSSGEVTSPTSGPRTTTTPATV